MPSPVRKASTSSGARRSRSPRRHPAGHLVGRAAVGLQVLAPARGQRVQQRGARAAVAHPAEPERRAVVRRGRGQRDPDRAAQRRRVHRLVGEVAGAAAQQHRLPPALPDRLVGAQPEQVLGAAGGPGRGRSSRRRPGAARAPPPPAAPPSLPLTRSAAAGQLVGRGHLGDQQLVALGVDRARVAVQHGEPGRADGHVGLPDPPGPAHRVGDHHRDLDAEPAAQLGAQPGGAAVRVGRQQRQLVAPHVGAVDAGRGLHDARACRPRSASGRGGPAPARSRRRPAPGAARRARPDRPAPAPAGPPPWTPPWR